MCWGWVWLYPPYVHGGMPTSRDDVPATSFFGSLVAAPPLAPTDEAQREAASSSADGSCVASGDEIKLIFLDIDGVICCNGKGL